MAGYVITTDSTVDLGTERMQELSVPFVKLFYTFAGEQYQDDMTDASAKRIYDAMRAGAVISTSQAIAEEFIQIWSKILDEGNDVLYIGFSSGLSGTVNSATIAKAELTEKYPERSICIVDSLCASGGEGMLLCHVIDKQSSGASYDECCAFAEDFKNYINHWYTVGDLTYLRRGGRVGATAALVANILGIKPVMNMDDKGHLIVREKIKGRKASIKRIFEHVVNRIDESKTPFFNITHADCLDDALQLKALLNERFPNIPVHISFVGAVIGAHCGPGTLAMFFVGKERITA